MAELVATGTGTVDVIASRLKAEAFYGMNGSAQPSSIRAGDAPIKRGTIAKSIMAANKANFIPPDVPDWQQRKISAAPLRPAHAQRAPNSRVTIPQRLSYPGAPVHPSVKPAKLGIFKR
jgi:hypothetical protein